MKKFFCACMLFISCWSFSQEKIQETRLTEEVFRVNLINPGVEYEFPTSDFSTLSTGLGVGYSGVIDELTVSKKTGFKYIIAPFLEVQHKLFYNLNKRKRKDKSIVNNSGNFITAGLQAKGPSIADNVERTSDYDFSLGLAWGIQRSYKEKYHLLFHIGPKYFFDTKGNGGFFPILIQLNLGFDL
ncbi:MAG: hypothetical protein ACTHYV_06835 [Psychroflexus sp.]|uniref:hypothetical protein n=1 Tax=Psychroflexus sp. S27 TaxID=1982757 RepID=UPI000C2B0F7D|nr:hypothetical protein [Psychroflexus sp. S27]PJX21551.1 hypothetical protein CAP47_07855 [Psychroflexus sp. S27]